MMTSASAVSSSVKPAADGRGFIASTCPQCRYVRLTASRLEPPAARILEHRGRLRRAGAARTLYVLIGEPAYCLDRAFLRAAPLGRPQVARCGLDQHLSVSTTLRERPSRHGVKAVTCDRRRCRCDEEVVDVVR